MIGPETNPTETDQAQLLRENEALRRKIAELEARGPQAGQATASPTTALWRPSRLTLMALALGTVLILVLAFFAGYLPLSKRNATLVAEAEEQKQALPRVETITVARATGTTDLQLPGSMEAITEAPVLARADGYVRKRSVDIGDRVRAGQLLAEIEAPELDQQVLQAKAGLDQAKAALEQAQANYEQGKSNMDLAKVTAQRWGNLGAKGVVSKQDNDRYQAEYQAQLANLQALEKAILAQRSNVAAAQANVSRLRDMQSYRSVRAPFDGVITQRNVDVGALVNAGNTLLFRIAQTGVLRTFVNVPQANADAIHPGQSASLSVSNLQGRVFNGVVARTANSLDPASRTLLVELHVTNTGGSLLPGMYCQVQLKAPRDNPPLLIPSDALIVRTGSALVAVVQPADHTIHFQKLSVGRDFGDRMEILSGLNVGDMIIPNPSDVVQENRKIEPIPKAAGK